MRLYECVKHGEKFTNGCSECERILKVIAHNKEVSDRTPRTYKLQSSVYWPTEMGHNGRLIHNLEHRPKFFATKRSYREYLKKHGVRESG